MKKESPAPKKQFHIVIGTPDEDNCPICRAHAKGMVDQGIAGALGQVLVQEMSLRDMLRCPCPLCVEGRQEALES